MNTERSDYDADDNNRVKIEGPTSRAIGRLVTFINVLEQLGSLKTEATMALWLEPLTSEDPNLIDAIFQCVQECEAELLVPIKMPGRFLDDFVVIHITVARHSSQFHKHHPQSTQSTESAQKAHLHIVVS